MANSYQGWYLGQTYPTWLIPLATDSGNEDLTGVNIATFVMIFHNTSVTPSADMLGTGVFTVATLSPASVYYKPSAADVANTFSGQLIIRAYFPPSGTSADTVVYDPIPFQITAV